MNIVILSVYPFPNGFAATNRIISYSRGLIELGCEVTNVIVRPTEKEDSPVNSEHKAEYLGIKYLYSNGNTKWSNNTIFKIFQIISGFISSLFYLVKINRKNKLDIVIVSIDNIFYDIFYALFSRIILNKKVLFISDEYPRALRNNISIYKNFPFLLNLVENFAYKFFDGIIVMTNNLFNYFKGITKNKIPIQLVLMTVETERFEKKEEIKKDESYLGYIGDLTCEKDGLDIMIKSFANISINFPKYKLKIAGSTKNKDDINKLVKLVKELRLNGKVEFLGKLKREDVPKFLLNAELLLLSRPKTERAEGGFPTKLGEYLATGNPVIVTSVGEIPFYLEDGKNAYLSVPGSEESFTQKLKEALENLDKAKIIGLEGKRVAQNVFDYRVQSKVMFNFLKETLNGRG